MLVEVENAKIYVSDELPKDLHKEFPLFFLYGLGCSISHWKYQISYFQSKRRIVWTDYRGHGNSTLEPGAEKVTLRRISEDIIDVLEQLKIESAVFLGQSMGGAIALDIARLAPKRVAALVLLGAPGRGPSQTLRVGRFGREIWNAMILTNSIAPNVVKRAYKTLPFLKPLMRELVRKDGFNPKLAKTSDIDQYVSELLKIDPVLFWQIAKDLERFDAFKWEDEIHAPTLVISGANDNLVPLSDAKRLAQKIPRGELAIFPHGSHCPHLDDPGEVNRVIEKFLTKYKL